MHKQLEIEKHIAQWSMGHRRSTGGNKVTVI
jgi:hypothetical protein